LLGIRYGTPIALIPGSGDGKPGRCFRIRYGTPIAKAVQVNRVEGQGRTRGNLFVYAVNRPYLGYAVYVNRAWQKRADLYIIPQCRAYCANDLITRPILPGDSAPFISSPFAARNEDQITFVTKRPQEHCSTPRKFIMKAAVETWIFYCLCRTICTR